MKVLLDTDFCIYIIRRKPPEILARFAAYEVGEIAISAITVAELMYGAHKGQTPEKNVSAVEQFLLPLEVAPFDYAAAETYGQVRLALEKAGTPIGALDTIIASHALQLGLTLVTNNTREYSRVPGLAVENWVGERET